jgi:DNA-binding SARP family transcriptional activator/tetratricopeptide (TPR) repeat protein
MQPSSKPFEALEAVHVSTALLGGFAVSVNGAPIDSARWKFKHPRLLWQMLCLAPGHQVSRDEAAETLWPQAGVQASSNRLYHTLHTLRGIFSGAGVADARRLVQLQGGTLRLDAAVMPDVDVQRFAQAVADARACHGSDAALAHLARAHEIHRGAFVVPAAAGDWFVPHQQALRRDQVWVLEQLTERYLAADRIDDAVQVGQALVQAEPSNEAAHRRLIELYDAQGRPDLVAQQYTACSRYLRRDLGLQPSLATRQLAERITAQAGEHAAQRAPAAADETAARQRFVAPPRATPLLGREAELGELQHWLQNDEGSRLITIAAAGGIGKTRLAAALAEQVQDRFADGVQFIALGDVQRPSRLAERICRALGLSSADQPADQLLPRALAARHLLLVLDRFEHLIEAAPQLVQWLQAAPRLHIVVTSQCSLKSRVERLYGLQPLSVRAPQAAVDLFVQTSARAGADLARAQHEPLIRRVCERLGGNALAIELAAAQLARVALADLPAALQAPLQLLVGATSPDDDPQHASLQATIGWSVSLLAADEAQLLAMVSVFAAEFSADDVQAVLGPFFETSALQTLLRTLLDRHLLGRHVGAGAGPPGRFMLADAVREQARHGAQALPQWPQVRAAHAAHFAQLVADAAELLRSGHGGRAHELYRLAAGDIEPSLQWYREHADRPVYLRACWRAAGVHQTFGALHEAIECLHGATALAAAGREESDQSAWCHYMLSRALGTLGDTAAAVRAVRTARQLARGSADPRLLGLIGTTLAMLRCTQLRVAQAIPLIEGVIRNSHRLGVTDQLSGQYNMLCTCLATRGDYPAAAAACAQSLDWALASNNPQAMLWALVSAAEIDVFRGHLDGAEASLRECRLLRDAGYSVASELQVALLSFYVAFERLDFEQTAPALAEARATCRGAMAERAIMVGVAQEFVLMETLRYSEVTLLRRLSDEQMPFDSDYGMLYVAAHCYGMFLQALDDDWSAVQATLARLRRPVRATGNAMWAAWVAQAAIFAAHRVGRPALARQLLDQSQRLLTSRQLTPSARQEGTWRNLKLLLQLPVDPHDDGAPRPLMESLVALSAELDRWCGQGTAGAAAVPALRAQRKVRASSLSSA